MFNIAYNKICLFCSLGNVFTCTFSCQIEIKSEQFNQRSDRIARQETYKGMEVRKKERNQKEINKNDRQPETVKMGKN
jgi:hypothetical protein